MIEETLKLTDFPRFQGNKKINRVMIRRVLRVYTTLTLQSALISSKHQYLRHLTPARKVRVMRGRLSQEGWRRYRHVRLAHLTLPAREHFGKRPMGISLMIMLQMQILLQDTAGTHLYPAAAESFLVSRL